MKTPMIARPRMSKVLNAALLMLLATSLGACMGDSNPAGPSPIEEPDTEPAPIATTAYDVRVSLSHFKVIADCDPGITQGAGEFDYTITIWGKKTDHYELVRKITGSFKRSDGESYTVARAQNFTLPAGGKYYIGMKATERDGILNGDDYLGYKQDVNTVGGSLQSSYSMTVGSGTCKLRLYYSVSESPRD